MSQSTDQYTVANASGATYRAAANADLRALASNASGSSAPANPTANMWWIDTTNGLLKRRNQGNSAWMNHGPAASTMVQAKTANYTVAPGDMMTLIDCTTGTFTLALTAAATLGDGHLFYVKNSGTGIVTIDPNSSETIDGATTLTVLPGDGFTVICNGTLFRTISRLSSNSVLVFTPNQSLTAGQTVFYTGSTFGLTETNVVFRAPFAGTIKNFYVDYTTAPGGAETFVATMRKELADTAMTATVSAAGTSASDLTHSFTVAAGDRIALKIVSSGGAATTVPKASAQLVG